MEAPRIPLEEADRQAELDALCLLDSPPEERFDRVTRTAQRLFRVNFVLVSLVDRNRQWFKSNQGLGASETPRQISFCGHAILSDDVLVVEDATRDPRFFDNPLVTGAPFIRFYAGVPLHGPNGFRIGTLCIIDTQPRPFSDQDMLALKDLGAMIDAELGSEVLNQALRTVNDREGKLRAIIQSSQDAIISNDLDGVVNSWNPAAERIFGYSATDMLGRTMSALIPAELQHEEAGFVEKLRQGSPIDSFETVRIKQDGSRLQVSVTLSPIVDGAGKVMAYSQIVRDISAQKRAQRELMLALKQADYANRAKSEFLANMSHEIRTPMNAVLGVTHLLGNTPLSTEQKNYLDMVKVSGQSLMNILNDILDFSKIEAGKMELCPAPFRLDGLLNAIATLMGVNAGEKDLELVIGVGADVPPVLMADALRLQQVLINLTGNAIKFTESGEVSLQVDLVSMQAKEIALRFTVRDTGIGMSPEQQNRLFSAFSQADASTTRRFGGTGLGLSISLRLVELMGSSIELRSQLGQGSEFSFIVRLDRVDEATEALFASESLGDLRLLVVDDHPTSLAGLRETILGCHWHVDTATSGREALACLQQSSRGERYDAILVDSHMPDMDGLATLQAIRALPQSRDAALILMCTAFGRGQLMQRGMTTAAHALLAKPITALSLRNALQQTLSGQDKGPMSATTAAGTTASVSLHAHILLVEDNPLNQVVAKSLLEQAGATLDIANNGQEAIDLLQAGANRYDLILMDVQMPVMDGFEATRIIRNQLKLTLPVLAMTAGVMGVEQARCTEVGMNDFIAKPIDIAQMFAVINRFLAPGSRSASVVAEAAVLSQSFDARQLQEVAQSSPEALGQLLEVVRQVVEQAPAQLNGARQAWEEGNGQVAARGLHGLRGSIGTLGAHSFCHISQTLEQAIKEGRNERIADLFDQLQHALTLTLAQARHWLEQQAS